MDELIEKSDSYWLVCPHCDYKHDDAWERVPDEELHKGIMQCESCEKLIEVWYEKDVQYWAGVIGKEPADG